MADPTSTRRDGLDETTRTSTIVRYVIRALLSVVAATAVARWFGIRLRGDDQLGARDAAIEFVVTAGLIAVALLLTTVFPLRRTWLKIARKVRRSEQDLQERGASQRFLRDVRIAFDMADYEDELYDVTEQVLAETAVGRAEILVADSSNAHVSQAAVAKGRDAPGCGLASPHRCPAVRRGSTLQFTDVNGIAACPRLRERDLAAGAVAACTPINVLGTPAAVLHVVHDGERLSTEELLNGVKRYEGVATRFGDRLGMIRAIAKTQLQANTDPLTGLLNRRATENKVRELRNEGTPFALAMADLDKFKQLNDTFGHDTGDRALRLFARTAQNTLRDHDLVSRHGGEEFVFVLPGATAAQAEPALHRIREALRDAVAAAHVPAFTVSMGVADSSWSDDLAEVLNAADRALLIAKEEGRDRIIIDEPDDDAEPRRPTTIVDYVGEIEPVESAEHTG